MRPLRLRMKAFGPYGGEVDLNMDRLGKRGLYLITGDTGAGKTTIFDGISYALYGETSGGIRSGEMMRSTFAEDGVPTEVELVFSYGGSEYRILRRPAYERAKKKGEGTIHQPAQCELLMADGRMITKDREATAAITELLGVDRTQFTQIAMIAQGDFLKLILADTRERIGTFRHLFKTEKYNELTEFVREEARQLEEARRECLQRIGMMTDSLEMSSEIREEQADHLIQKAREGAATSSEIKELSNMLLEEDREKIGESKGEAEALDKELAKMQARLSRAEDSERLREDLERSRTAAEETEKELKEISAALSDAENAVPEIDEIRKQAAAMELRIKQGAEEEKRSLLKQEENKRKKEEEYEEAAAEYNRLADENEKLQNKYRSLQRMFTDAQAGVLARDLIEGVACPVCGSKTHPAPAVLPEGAPTEREVRQAEKEAAASQKKADAASKRAADLKGQVTVQREETEKKIAELEAGIERLEDEKEKLADLRAREDELQENININRKKKEELTLKREGINSRIETIEKALEGGVFEDADALRETIEDLSGRRKKLDEEAETRTIRMAANERSLNVLIDEMERLAEEEERYGSVRGLADTLSGTRAGAEKVMLETYVQMRFFDRIIERANTRLLIMSGGRYRMIRRREARSNRGQSGLDLNVIDYHNGSERDIRTLSGGESFDASLALALGLSDEVQSCAGGIELDTMFVDEGFGSLDPEALDRAIKALASLSESDKLVGIISHVDEMKSRKDRQIRVTKGESGVSTAEII